MHANLRFKLDLAHALQGFAQNCNFELQLPLIRNVLIMASAALPEIWTTRFDAIG